MTELKTVLVTGANGFIGTHLVEKLLTSGFAVRAVARETVAIANTPRFTSVRIASLKTAADWDVALRDIDSVVHLAARVHVMSSSADDRRLFHETNVLATESLAKVATRNGVRRFVFLSTIKVNGEATSHSPFTPNDPHNPLDDYGRSKWQAEQRLFTVAGGADMIAAAIRSPLVYGPKVKANFLRLMAWVEKGVPLPFGSVANRRSLISVWNLCDLIMRVIEAPTIRSGVLMASDGEDLSTPDLIRRLGQALSRPVRLVPVPSFLLNAVGIATGRKAEIARLCGSLVIDIGETRRQLDWIPPLSVDEGLKRTAQWYLEEIDANRP